MVLNFSAYGQIENTKDTISNYTIEFFTADSIAFPNYFSNQRLIDSISNPFGNAYNKSLAVEKIQIQNLNFKIEIEDEQRIVNLTNGKQICLSPEPHRGEVGIAFEKYFKELNSLHFRTQWHEGNDYFLFNTITREKIYTIGRLYINTNNTFAMSISADIFANFSGNGFQLFQIKNNNLIPIWRYNPHWAPEEIIWESENQLVVKAFYNVDGDPTKIKYFYKRLNINDR